MTKYELKSEIKKLITQSKLNTNDYVEALAEVNSELICISALNENKALEVVTGLYVQTIPQIESYFNNILEA